MNFSYVELVQEFEGVWGGEEIQLQVYTFIASVVWSEKVRIQAKIGFSSFL